MNSLLVDLELLDHGENGNERRSVFASDDGGTDRGKRWVKSKKNEIGYLIVARLVFDLGELSND